MTLRRSDIREMLLSRDGEQKHLFELARSARRKIFGTNALLRGVIEVTNVCRVNCDYCPMRRANTAHNTHYILSSEDIVNAARAIKDHGINIVLLQGGETPGVLSSVEKSIPKIVSLFDGKVEILLNLGCFEPEQYSRFKRLGATSYILKHETSDSELHWRIRHETLQHRIRCLRNLRRLGYRLGTGLISGLPGQSLDSIIDDIFLAGDLGVDMCSVSPFVPANGTPMAQETPGNIDLALNTVSCLRLLYPELLIPSVSAFERVSQDGQIAGLNAGANVLTVNFSSVQWRDSYLIYGSDRFVVTSDHAHRIAANAGLSLRGSVFLEKKHEQQDLLSSGESFYEDPVEPPIGSVARKNGLRGTESTSQKRGN